MTGREDCYDKSAAMAGFHLQRISAGGRDMVSGLCARAELIVMVLEISKYKTITVGSFDRPEDCIVYELHNIYIENTC